MRFTFGDFVLDCDTRQLLRGEREVHASPKELLLLELLLKARPRAVSRTRLHTALWPNTHVGATSLHVLVSQLRATLGDDAHEPRYVRTVAGFGYSFPAPADRVGVPEAAAVGRFSLDAEGATLALVDGENVLGRDEALAARVEGPGVSRRHARIDVRDGRATLVDLGSKNGTFVDGARLEGPRALRDGDTIRLGRRVSLVFRSHAADPTETEAGA
jgi:DNA-binding winged helix-turn-helix (wHTH) protein